MRRALITIVVVLLLNARAGAGDMKHPSFAGAVHTGDPIVAGVNNTALTPISPKLIASLYANLPVEQDGQLLYCSDCLKASPCVGGGTGAFAFGQRGAWQCSPPPIEGTLTTTNLSAGPGSISITGNQTNGADKMSHVSVNGVINVQDYGAKCDSGTTNNTSAFAAATTAALASGASHTVYVPGCSQGSFYQINVPTGGTGINLSANSAAATSTNAGVTFFGDGEDQSVIQFHTTGTNDTGVGIDLSGAAYFYLGGLRINSGASTADTVRTAILLGKVCTNGVAPCSGSNLLFSGNGVFDRALVTRFGDYGLYDLSAESINIRDSQFPATGTATTPTVVLSRANTTGITSPNVTLNSPGDSMTAVSFTGFGQSLGSNGPEFVLLDAGSTTGIASISFDDAYFNLTNPTGVAVVSNGTGSSVIDRIHCNNCKVEANGGAGTNQVFSLSAGTVEDVFFTGALSSSVAQTAAEFVWSNPLLNSYIDWEPNDAGAKPASLLSTTANPALKGTLVKTSDALSTLNGITAGTGSFVLLATDGSWIYGNGSPSGANGIDAVPIGVNVQSTGKFTMATVQTLTVSNLLLSATAPTISSGFGTGPSIVKNNGTAAFTINVGTGGSATSGVIGLPTAANGWDVNCKDITTTSATVFMTKQTASGTASATVGNFNTSGAAAAWVASDILSCTATAY